MRDCPSELVLLHAADLHLDRAFTERGLRGSASARRLALRDALARIAQLAREADVLCLAGDLYEHEHVSADTEAALVTTFASVPCRVLLLPGNHDPHLPGSVYARARWSPNVHVFREARPEPVPVAPGVVVWGIAHTTRELDADVVRRFRAPADGQVHLLLLHAALAEAPGAGDGGLCTLTSRELEATGVAFALLGHHHAGRISGRACYPGSPEPLTWGERGVHAVDRLRLVAGVPQPELVAVNRLSFEEIDVVVTGAASSLDVETRVREALAPRADDGRSLRVTLRGEVAPACEISSGELARRCGDGFGELLVEDRTRPAYDLAQIARERTVRGRFVAGLLRRAEAEPERAERLTAAAHAGLRALDGRRELLDVG